MAKRTNRLKTALISEMRASPLKGAVLLGGVAVLIGLGVRHFAGGPKAAEAATGDALLAVPLAETPTADGPAPIEFLPRPEVAHNLVRNPFDLAWLAEKTGVTNVAATTEDADPNELTLQFTMTGTASGGGPVAVISGTVVEVGMQYGRYVVEHIEERFVLLRDGENVIQLEMQ